jgi:hypothetical protein
MQILYAEQVQPPRDERVTIVSSDYCAGTRNDAVSLTRFFTPT